MPDSINLRTDREPGEYIESRDVNQIAQAVNHLASRSGTSLKTGASLATLTSPGYYYANTWSIANTIADRPAGASSQPFHVEVILLSTTNNVYVQQFIQWSADGPVHYERISLHNEYGPWQAPSDDAWWLDDLTSGTNLSAIFTPGVTASRTSAITATILGRPEGSTTQPFTLETKELSSTNGVYYQRLTQWSSTGPVHFERQSLQKTYGAWTPMTHTRWVYGTGVHFYGDSLVSDGWPNYLTDLSGPVVNRGRGGDTSNDVLLRAGIIRIYATPVGGSIPASGPVTLNLHGRRLDTRNGRTFTMTWAGVAGSLAHVSGESWTFTRSAAGSAIPIPSPTPLVSTQAAPADAVLGFFFGTNDAWHGGHAPDPDLATHIISNYQRAIESVAPTPERHALVMGMITTKTTTPGSDRETLVKRVNTHLSTTAPHLYVSLQDYMVHDALDDLGLTPSPEDAAATVAGLIPPTLYADEMHLTQAAQEAFAIHRVKPTLQARGWA